MPSVSFRSFKSHFLHGQLMTYSPVLALLYIYILDQRRGIQGFKVFVKTTRSRTAIPDKDN